MQQISRETFGRTLPISLTLAALDFLNKCSAIFAANTFCLPDILAVSLSLSSRPQFHYYNLGFVAFASRFQICFYSENSCLRTIFNQNFLLNFPRMIEYSGTKKICVFCSKFVLFEHCNASFSCNCKQKI